MKEKIVLLLLGYFMSSLFIGRLKHEGMKVWFSSACQLSFCYFLFFANLASGNGLTIFSFLIGIFMLQFLLAVTFKADVSILGILSIYFPWLLLILLKAFPKYPFSDFSVWFGSWAPMVLVRLGLFSPEQYLGLSYLAFRSSLFTLEIRNDSKLKVNLPGFLEHLFYVPTFLMGPISSISIRAKVPRQTVRRIWENILRLTLGICKVFFLSPIFYQLTFSRILDQFDGISFFQASLAFLSYPIYLFFNFSGFCDIAISASSLLGIRIQENFNEPFKSQTLQQFWQRWHISLGQYLNLIVFTPLSKFLFLKTSNSRWISFSKTFAISISLFAVFTILGLWHGFQLNYLIFGLVNAVGLVLERIWGTERGESKRQSHLSNGNIQPWWQLIWERAGVYLFVCFSFFFFENSMGQIELLFFKLLYP